MSRMTSFKAEQALLDFAKRATEAFAKNPIMATFGDVEPGTFLALRWGMGNDCVLVVRLDEDFPPVNFQQAISRRVPA